MNLAEQHAGMDDMGEFHDQTHLKPHPSWFLDDVTSQLSVLIQEQETRQLELL